MSIEPYGVIRHIHNTRATDYLFRLSLKCVIKNQQGEVLVVKELDRDYWDIPGGGMDHGESIEQAIRRELTEEVGYSGKFAFTIRHIEQPVYLSLHNFYQTRLIFEVIPNELRFKAGIDSDEVKFINPHELQYSKNAAERMVYSYASLF
ncbi:NUDIX hydrolase [Candidatus Saccharibacteria bacterium]|nr:NUDIX hydrolase [Candidatus Saccharibacteria bacterium]